MKIQKAFTLIEILVAIVAGFLVLLALYSTYIFNLRSYRMSTNQQELSQNARIALERISRDLRQTDRVVTTLPLNNNDLLNPPPSQILFQDGHVTNKIQYLKYYLDGTNLRRQLIHYYFSNAPTVWVSWNAQDQFGNPPVQSIDEDLIKADKLSALKFYGNKVITIELQVSNTESTFDFKSAVWGRNIQ